jgi:type VI secretion system secreted protein VgrG
MVLSRVGWEQSVAYINGDPDRPLGFARNINGEMTPRYAQPANKTRMTINTPSYPQTGGFNELRLEDMAGQQHFDWQAEKDYTGTINHNRTETVAGNETRGIADNAIHSVDNTQQRSVGGDLKLQVGGSYPVSVGSDRSVSIGGDEKFKLANHSTRCEGDDTESVGGDWDLDVGREDKGALIRDIAKDYTWSIGADHEVKSKGNIRIRVDEKFTETVSGSKSVEVTDGACGGTVTGDVTSEVGGNVARIAKDAAGIGSEDATVTIQGGLAMKSDQRISMRGERIRLESKTSLKLSAGDLSLELARSSVKVEGKIKLKAASQIVTTGTPMNIAK